MPVPLAIQMSGNHQHFASFTSVRGKSFTVGNIPYGKRKSHENRGCTKRMDKQKPILRIA